MEIRGRGGLVEKFIRSRRIIVDYYYYTFGRDDQ